jgi:hypothetical protein
MFAQTRLSEMRDEHDRDVADPRQQAGLRMLALQPCRKTEDRGAQPLAKAKLASTSRRSPFVSPTRSIAENGNRAEDETIDRYTVETRLRKNGAGLSSQWGDS